MEKKEAYCKVCYIVWTACGLMYSVGSTQVSEERNQMTISTHHDRHEVIHENQVEFFPSTIDNVYGFLTIACYLAGDTSSHENH